MYGFSEQLINILWFYAMLDVMGISLQPDLTPYLNLLGKLDYFSKPQL